MKIVLIFDSINENDWSLFAFKKEFEKGGAEVHLLNINDLEWFHDCIALPEREFPEIQRLIEAGYTVWINRVYPSNNDCRSIKKASSIISWLNFRSCMTINPPMACAADYDKLLAYRLMQKNNVPTPETFQITEVRDLDACIDKISLPCVIKLNTGGKGRGVVKVNSQENLANIFSQDELFSGRYLIQKFVRPIINYDVRIVVIDGKAVLSYARTLVNHKDSDPWMGSCDHGSKIIDYQAAENEKRIAVAATKAIGAVFNEVDIQITSGGPVIIENNPTPGCNKGGDRWIAVVTGHLMEFILQQNNLLKEIYCKQYRRGPRPALSTDQRLPGDESDDGYKGFSYPQLLF